MKLASAIIAALLLFGVYTANILFTDGMHFSKGSYKYLLTISSDTIASFPMLEPDAEPDYFYSSRDGTAPSVQQITYNSEAEQEVLEATIQSYLIDVGFRKGEEFFVNGNESIKVSIERQADNLIKVSAKSTGNYNSNGETVE